MDRELTEPGKYTGTFVAVEVGKSPNTGTPCVATTWHIEEEDIDRTVYTYINKNTKKTSFKKLEAMGFNGDFKAPAISVEQIELRCVHSQYVDKETGEEKENEKWDLASWGGAAVEDADAKTIANLNAMWKKRDAGDTAATAAKPKAAKKGAAKKGAAKKATPPPPEAEPEPEAPEDEPEADDEDETPSDGKTPRERAWESFLENKASEEAIEGLEDGKSSKAVMEWATVLTEAVPDKEEVDFDAEDWKGVKLFCEVPY
jgi:hypothetical protein